MVDQNRMNEFLDTVEVKLTSTNFVTTGNVDYWSAVVFYEPKQKKESIKDEKLTFEDLSHKEWEIFFALKQWRNQKATDLGWTAFRICHNSHLMAIAEAKPESIEELAKVKGFGEVRTEKYGDDIMSVLNAL